MGAAVFREAFKRVHADRPLPRVYRDFVAGAAFDRLHSGSLIGLEGYGPESVRMDLDSPLLLDRDALLEAAGIDEDDPRFHPVAVIPLSSQFLAIDVTDDAAPVYLCRHETGAYHKQFETFGAFLAALSPLTESDAGS